MQGAGEQPGIIPTLCKELFAEIQDIGLDISRKTMGSELGYPDFFGCKLQPNMSD